MWQIKTKLSVNISGKLFLSRGMRGVTAARSFRISEIKPVSYVVEHEQKSSLIGEANSKQFVCFGNSEICLSRLFFLGF